jgi:PAS domain S-box-containing protein
MIDGDGVIALANFRCSDVLQISPEGLHGQSVSTLLAPSSRSDFAVLLTGMAEGTTMPEVEVCVLATDGRELPMMLDIRQIEDADLAFLVRLRDLREIKALEQEYRGLFESIADAVFIGDPETGQILQANRRACEITGYQLGELMGQDFGLVHSEDWDSVQKAMSSEDGRSVAGMEMHLVGKDGREVPVEMHMGIAPHGDDKVFVETLINISKRKALEKHMRGLRTEWDSFMRHELRSPLTPILAFSQLLLEDYDEVKENPKIVRYLDSIYQGGKRLERLLDLTREVQQYERGEIPMQPLKGDIYKTVETSIMDAAMGVDAEKGETEARVHVTRADDEPIAVIHDPQILQRAVANLIKNALEHDPGEIRLRVSDEDRYVGIHVTNAGPPIPPDRLESIFEKFNTTKRDSKGTGLGTTIAKLFVEAHDGMLSVMSNEQDGTTFTITIPKAGPIRKEEE